MSRATTYRHRARLCRLNANGSVSEAERIALLEEADSWMALANFQDGAGPTRGGGTAMAAGGAPFNSVTPEHLEARVISPYWDSWESLRHGG